MRLTTARSSTLPRTQTNVIKDSAKPDRSDRIAAF